MPPDTPDTRPEETPMVATDVVTLLHVPPGVVGTLRAEVAPAHSVSEPLMAPGSAVTVTVLVTKQPVLSV